MEHCSRHGGKRRLHRQHSSFTRSLTLSMFVMLLSTLSTSPIFPKCWFRHSFSVAADYQDHEADEEFLAEILAEEARQQEEHVKIEAEMKDYQEVLRAQQLRQQQSTTSGGKRAMGNMPHGGQANLSQLEAELKRKEAEKATYSSKIAAEKLDEEQQAVALEQTRRKREAAFEAELQKMNEQQKKRARKQKVIDAKVVRRILRAFKAGKHYAVLGICNFEIQLGPYYISIFGKDIIIGPFVLFRVPTKKIKRVYRNIARMVHPDKNKDGRAEEAFHAIETSAAILTDEKKRADYDKKIIISRRRRNQYALESAFGISGKVWQRSMSAMCVVKRVLGPFSTPILVVSALIL